MDYIQKHTPFAQAHNLELDDYLSELASIMQTLYQIR